MRQTSVHPDIIPNLQSFGRHLRAENLSPKTIETYTESAGQLAKYLEAQGMPQQLANIHREHIEAIITHLLEIWKPATANNRFRGLQSFFKGLQEEGESRTTQWSELSPPGYQRPHRTCSGNCN